MDDEHLNNQSSLRINPAVIEAEACKAAASTSHLPNVFPFQQSAKVINNVCVCVRACVCVHVYVRVCVCTITHY